MRAIQRIGENAREVLHIFVKPLDDRRRPLMKRGTMGLVSQVSADDRESAWRIVRHREIMERLIPLWAVLGVALVLMGVDLGGHLLWTLPMIGYVFGVMAVDHGPDYRAANYWVPVLGSQAAALLPLIARF
jgi:hypothetical protein